MSKRKIMILLIVIYLLMTVGSFFINIHLGLSFSIILIIGLLSIITFLLLNMAVKQTNWWKNQFIYTHRFVSNAGYRKYLTRNLEIVNVGSNPACFGFFYENVLGENWSSGTQGLNMDFEILKYRFSFLKEGGVVLLPLVLFSSVSEYLNTKKEWRNAPYYVKYFDILDPYQVRNLSNFKKIAFYHRFPLAYLPKALRYLIVDVSQDNRILVSEQSLQYTELEKDAENMISGWKAEFDIKKLEEPLHDKLKEGMKESSDIMKEMIDFLIERNLKPILVYLPMSEVLSSKISEKVRKNYVYDFVEMIGRPQIRFLDYSKDKSLRNNSYFMNSLFLNLNGRKLFTKKVLKDLGLRTDS